MDEAKKKVLDEKLRQLFQEENPSVTGHRSADAPKTWGPRVIRRRKGRPDVKVV
jgi:hypothetical protein